MLKLTYTSTGVTLERSVESLEATVRRRVFLSLQVGQPLGLEQTSVSLLVNRSLPTLKPLMAAIATTPTPTLQLAQTGSAQVEMQLQGYWLAQQETPGEGIFLMNLEPTLEGYLVNLWQASQQDPSCCP